MTDIIERLLEVADRRAESYVSAPLAREAANEIELLRAAFETEWLMNHQARCGIDVCKTFGGNVTCYHPRPTALPMGEKTE